MDFEWIILLIFIPVLVIIPVGLILIALYERKQKKSPKLKTKDWGAEKRLNEKEDDRGFVACSDCGKLCDSRKMSAFGYWKTSSFIVDWVGVVLPSEADGYEEVIPDKKSTHTYSFVKDLCPSCATRLRTKMKIYNQELKIVGLALLVFLLVIILKLWIQG